MIELPDPRHEGALSVEEALRRRRSVREFAADPLKLSEISQLLWAAQGITHPEGLRTTPSAGALYPLEIYVGAAAGLDHFQPTGHCLHCVGSEDPRPLLARAALEQEAVGQAPAVFLITAVFARIEDTYGHNDGPRYVHLEAGHAAQNLMLQAVSLDLASVAIGAFYPKRLQKALSLPADHHPLYMVPVGRPA